VGTTIGIPPLELQNRKTSQQQVYQRIRRKAPGSGQFELRAMGQFPIIEVIRQVTDARARLGVDLARGLRDRCVER
jgi:hypothetical protein